MDLENARAAVASAESMALATLQLFAKDDPKGAIDMLGRVIQILRDAERDLQPARRR